VAVWFASASGRAVMLCRARFLAAPVASALRTRTPTTGLVAARRPAVAQLPWPRYLSTAGKQQPPPSGSSGSGSGSGSGGSQQLGSIWTNPLNTPKGESLVKYGTDLTAQARAGKLDPVLGREEEIRRTIQVRRHLDTTSAPYAPYAPSALSALPGPGAQSAAQEQPSAHRRARCGQDGGGGGAGAAHR